MKWQRFTEGVWNAWAGAESFADGCVPLFAEMKVDGDPAVAILDAGGLHVFLAGPEAHERVTAWHAREEYETRALAMLPEETTALALTSVFGFIGNDGSGLEALNGPRVKIGAKYRRDRDATIATVASVCGEIVNLESMALLGSVHLSAFVAEWVEVS